MDVARPFLQEFREDIVIVTRPRKPGVIRSSESSDHIVDVGARAEVLAASRQAQARASRPRYVNSSAVAGS